jgi:exopolyphosphatase / guanosine-5'-triphosphate,3'-diphosphate pyrophosphatase
MPSARRAVIDVGTNSVKLLVADVRGREVRPVWEDSSQTRLGSGFYRTRRLQPEPVARTAAAVASFARVAREWNAATTRVIATSAAREALNPGDLVSAVAGAAGLVLEIISGDQEAEWVFQGVATNPDLGDQPILLLDVGGGSTEFIVGRGRHKHFHASFPLGTVRLMETLPHSDPPRPEELAACRLWLQTFFGQEILPRVKPALRHVTEPSSPAEHVQLVGTGGTTSILARIEGQMDDYNRRRIDHTRLSLARVRHHVNRLWSLPLAERQQIVGLPRNRADVILTGAAIYEAVLEQFRLSELRVSTRGLRFAAVMSEQPVGDSGLAGRSG